MNNLALHLLTSKDDILNCQALIAAEHYLHAPVDPRSRPEFYQVRMDCGAGWSMFVAYLIFGRPEATRCGQWYGSVDDVQAGRCEVTRWQVLNLARLWIAPEYQPGGSFNDPAFIPGF